MKTKISLMILASVAAACLSTSVFAGVTINTTGQDGVVRCYDLSGGLVSQLDLALGGPARELVLGDGANTGKMDAYVAGFWSMTRVLGTGSSLAKETMISWEPQTYAWADPLCTTLGDVNGDGKNEVMFGSLDWIMSLGYVDGAWGVDHSIFLGGATTTMAFGDTDNNGLGEVFFTVGSGSVCFENWISSAKWWNVPITDVTFGPDVNGDGKNDMITCSTVPWTGLTAVWNRTPDAMVDATGFLTYYGDTAVAIGKITTDRNDVVVCGNYESIGYFSVANFDGTWTVDTKVTTMNGPTPIRLDLHDVDGDSLDEVFMLDSAGSIFYYDFKDGGVTRHDLVAAGTAITDFRIGDIGLDTGVLVQGTIVLNDYTLTADGLVAVISVNATDGSVLETHNVALAADGSYSFIAGVALNGTDVTMTAKVSHWLAQKSATVNLGGDVTQNFTLINGDIDLDNEVTSTDLSILGLALGSMPGDTNWDASADIDGDGEITSTDLSILGLSLGTIGD